MWIVKEFSLTALKCIFVGS